MTILPPRQRTPREQGLEDIYWTAYREAQYLQRGTTQIPPGLDDEERRTYWDGLAGGAADRRATAS